MILIHSIQVYSILKVPLIYCTFKWRAFSDKLSLMDSTACLEPLCWDVFVFVMIDTYQNLFLSLKVRDLCIWIPAMIYTYLLGMMMSSFQTLETIMYHYGSNFSWRKCIHYICTIKAIEQTHVNKKLIAPKRLLYERGHFVRGHFVRAHTSFLDLRNILEWLACCEPEEPCVVLIFAQTAIIMTNACSPWYKNIYGTINLMNTRFLWGAKF